MKIFNFAIAQINSHLGNFIFNANKIIFFIKKAQQNNTNLIVFPEMSLIGYPPEDLIFKNHFIKQTKKHLKTIIKNCHNIIVVIGTITKKSNIFYNSAIIIENCKIKKYYHKQILPNKDVFDEKRYFKKGKKLGIIKTYIGNLGISICEDIWVQKSPIDKQTHQDNINILINISASPYHSKKIKKRYQIIKKKAKKTNKTIFYCNLIGGQDELLFDGQSLVVNKKGVIIKKAQKFKEDIIFVQTKNNNCNLNKKINNNIEDIYNALVLGTRDYIVKNNFKSVLIGLSGGIDSALTATIATDAIGSQNVFTINMPSIFTNQDSLLDSQLLAKNLSLNYTIIKIDNLFQMFLHILNLNTHKQPENNILGTTHQNLQARIRGCILMTLSNQFNMLILNTSNKSELAIGYSTLYGDTIGGFSVLKDIYKTIVYKLCNNKNSKKDFNLIPKNIITKEPSGELYNNQKDINYFLHYNYLDKILTLLIEEELSIKKIINKGFNKKNVKNILYLIYKSEYKRKQIPIGLKITTKAFGKGWKIPITKY